MSTLNNLARPNQYFVNNRHNNISIQNEKFYRNPCIKTQGSNYNDYWPMPDQMDQDQQNNEIECNTEQMELLESMNNINDGETTDEEIKCIDTPTRSDTDTIDENLNENNENNDIKCSLSAITYLGSGLEGSDDNYLQLKQLFHLNPLKWCQIINFLVQIHYDMGHPALKPNIISLCAEYLAYLTNKGHFKNMFFHGNELIKNNNNKNDINIRKSYDIRMALFEAVKYDQGFQMEIAKLFDLNYYPKPMVFCQNKQMYSELKYNKENKNKFTVYCDENDNKTNQELIDWLRVKEIEFCNKIDWKFAFSTRFQTLMVYLKRLGFDTNSIISQQYKNIKIEFNRRKALKLPLFDDNIKFGFLCRFLLEMSYYKPDFYSYTKNDLIIAIIYSAYIIAQKWKEKFDFNNLLNTKTNLYKLLDDKHPVANETIYNIIKKIIRIGRSPHSCYTYCTPIYCTNPNTGTQTHYHTCKCILNCCLNSYLKYSKIAFCEISKMPCLSTSNLNKFADFYDNFDKMNGNENMNANIDSVPIIRAFASNKSLF